MRPFGGAPPGHAGKLPERSIVHQGLIGVFGEQYEHVTFQNADKHARDKTRGLSARMSASKSARAKAAGLASPALLARGHGARSERALFGLLRRARKTTATIIAPPIAANGAKHPPARA